MLARFRCAATISLGLFTPLAFANPPSSTQSLAVKAVIPPMQPRLSFPQGNKVHVDIGESYLRDGTRQGWGGSTAAKIKIVGNSRLSLRLLEPAHLTHTQGEDFGKIQFTVYALGSSTTWAIASALSPAKTLLEHKLIDGTPNYDHYETMRIYINFPHDTLNTFRAGFYSGQATLILESEDDVGPHVVDAR